MGVGDVGTRLTGLKTSCCGPTEQSDFILQMLCHPKSQQFSRNVSNSENKVRIGDHLIRLPRALIDSSTPAARLKMDKGVDCSRFFCFSGI